MKLLKIGLPIIAATLIAGCAQNSQQDNYLEASFELCNTEVNLYFCQRRWPCKSRM